MRRLTLLALAACALAGCTVGPDYHRPDVAGAKAPWVGPIAPGHVDDHWWRALHDPKLDALVDAALTHNLDIAEAEANLRQARANREIAASAFAPQINASGSGQETQVSANGELPVNHLPGFTREFSLFDGGFDASWELDIWGAVRRSVQEARARGDQSAAALADTRLRVVAEVVRAWSDLRAFGCQHSGRLAPGDQRRSVFCRRWNGRPRLCRDPGGSSEECGPLACHRKSPCG
jgi:outer membrane protein TolC